MKLRLFLIVQLILSVYGLVNSQPQTKASSAKKEIKKDSKEVAAGARQAWHVVKDAGRTVGHKTKKVAKKAGQGTKKVAKDVKNELKK